MPTDIYLTSEVYNQLVNELTNPNETHQCRKSAVVEALAIANIWPASVLTDQHREVAPAIVH